MAYVIEMDIHDGQTTQIVERQRDALTIRICAALHRWASSQLRIRPRFAPHRRGQRPNNHSCCRATRESRVLIAMLCPHCHKPISTDVIRSEFARTIKPPAPRARVELPCVQCAHPLSARERRKPCPKCGCRQPRESSV